MDIRELTTALDFQEIQHDDLLIVKFRREQYPKKHLIETFRVYENKVNEPEIILQKRNNIYFNWRMFLAGSSCVKKVFKVFP